MKHKITLSTSCKIASRHAGHIKTPAANHLFMVNEQGRLLPEDKT